MKLRKSLVKINAFVCLTYFSSCVGIVPQNFTQVLDIGENKINHTFTGEVSFISMNGVITLPDEEAKGALVDDYGYEVKDFSKSKANRYYFEGNKEIKITDCPQRVEIKLAGVNVCKHDDVIKMTRKSVDGKEISFLEKHELELNGTIELKTGLEMEGYEPGIIDQLKSYFDMPLSYERNIDNKTLAKTEEFLFKF